MNAYFEELKNIFKIIYTYNNINTILKYILFNNLLSRFGICNYLIQADRIIP